MKILFLCTCFDSTLKKRVKALQDDNNIIDVLDILEYKMVFDTGKTISIRPKSKYKIFEYLFVLDEINEYVRRRELFDYLDNYDLVEIYKCSQYAVHLRDKIKNISLKYVITPNEILPKNSGDIINLYNDSKLFFFQEDLKKRKFQLSFGYKNNILLYDPVKFFEEFDKIKTNILDEFINYLNIDTNKKILFTQMNGPLSKQKSLLKSIANLPKSIKTEVTFILYFENGTDDMHQELEMILENISLDYLIVNKTASNEQLAMLLKLASTSIFINPNIHDELLLTSLYAKNHLFLFEPKNIDPIFHDNQIFIDNFIHIKNIFEDDEINREIFREIFNRNKTIVESLFHPKKFTQRYLEEVVK